MNKSFKISLLFLIPLLINACSASSKSVSEDQLSTLDEVQRDNKVRIGVRFDNPPLSFQTESGEWVGFDIDLAHAIAKSLNVELELVKVDELTRISFLQQNKIHLAVASMNHTRARDNAIDFSITYFWDNQSFLVRAGTYQHLDDLLGKKVAANTGSSAIPAWNSYANKRGYPQADIAEFSDKLAAIQALRDGVVEGYTEDNITLLSLAVGDSNLVLVPGGFNPVQFGIGLPENDSLWRDKINFILQDLWQTGVYQEIYIKWFDSDSALIKLPLVEQMEIWP